MLSPEFFERLKAWPESQYKIAKRFKIHQSLLSQWLYYAKWKKRSPRREGIIRGIAKLIGCPEKKIFTSELKYDDKHVFGTAGEDEKARWWYHSGFDMVLQGDFHHEMQRLTVSSKFRLWKDMTEDEKNEMRRLYEAPGKPKL